MLQWPTYTKSHFQHCSHRVGRWGWELFRDQDSHLMQPLHVRILRDGIPTHLSARSILTRWPDIVGCNSAANLTSPEKDKLVVFSGALPENCMFNRNSSWVILAHMLLVCGRSIWRTRNHRKLAYNFAALLHGHG